MGQNSVSKDLGAEILIHSVLEIVLVLEDKLSGCLIKKLKLIKSIKHWRNIIVK